MKALKQLIASSFAVALIAFGSSAAAEARAPQERPYRLNDRQVEQIIRSVERRADSFRRSFDQALDRSPLDGTGREDEANNLMRAFEEATNDLRERFNGRRSVAADVRKVLERAARIDEFTNANLRYGPVQRDWALLRRDLDRLAGAYNVTFSFGRQALPPSAVGGQRPYRVQDRQVDELLRRMERRSDRFRRELDGTLDRSRLDGTDREDNINELVKEFESATDELRKRFDERRSVAGDVETVLTRARRIDEFLRRNLRLRRVQGVWSQVRADLNQLARYYNVA